jgi:hypothetical protein
VGAGLVIGLGHEKRTWKKERSTDWFDHIVLETFDDDQWIENFRCKGFHLHSEVFNPLVIVKCLKNNMVKPVRRTFFFPCPFFMTQSNDQTRSHKVWKQSPSLASITNESVHVSPSDV